MPKRGFEGNYRYGFNGQEKDDEINNISASMYTAEFWQYDARLGRRWNLDPKPTIGLSDYACFVNNPISLSDPDGDSSTDPQSGKRNETLPNTELSADSPIKKINDAQLNIGYFGIDRIQLGGNAKLQLNTDFSYIRPFSGDTRFAPDEASSMSYVNRKFSDNNQYLSFSIGGFRNHTKGDFLFENGSKVHFGIGNSQVGLGIGVDVNTKSFKGFTASASIFIGAGPQISKFTSENNTVTPNNWKIRGFGEVAMFGVSINSAHTNISRVRLPSDGLFNGALKRVALRGVVNPIIATVNSSVISVQVMALVHHAVFQSFSVSNTTTGVTTDYSKVQFTTGGVAPTVQMNFTLHDKQYRKAHRAERKH